jgi:TolB-like protein
MRNAINHGAPVFCAVFASRGEVLLSGGADASIRTWIVANSMPLQTLVGHSGPVRSLAITKDGAHVLSGSYDGTIRIWRLSDGVPVRTIANLNGTSMCLAVIPDGTMFISGRSDSTIKLWHLPVTEDGVSHNTGPMSRMAPPEHRMDSRLAGTTVAILVTPLECPAMDTVRSGTLTEKLRVELDQAGGFRVMERDRLDAVMAEQGRWLSGCFTNTCASNIGDLAGADYVIVGRVAQIEDMYSVTLRIVETATSETVGSTAMECSPCAFSGVMRESMRAAAMALRDDFQRRARGR